MKTILHALHIHAQPSAAYAALTTAEGLAGWWSSRVTVEPGAKGLIRFTFAGDFNPVMRQDATSPGREVRWTCVDGHANWQDNTFSFLIEPRKGECVLRLAWPESLQKRRALVNNTRELSHWIE